MGEWVAIASAVSSVVSAVSTVAQGAAAGRASEAQARENEYQARSLESEAAQYRSEAETARVNAVIEETDRRRELSRVLATQEAVRAGRGLAFDTGSSDALRSSSEGEAQRDIGVIQANSFGKQRQMLDAAASASERAGLLRMRPSGGGGAGYYLQAGAQLLSGARSAYGAYKQFNQPSAPSS